MSDNFVLIVTPAISEAFTHNMLRCHLQVLIRKTAISTDPPRIDSREYGWVDDPTGHMVIPRTVDSGVSLAPDYLLKLIKCGRSSNTPCKSSNYSCSKSLMGCTIFCGCYGEKQCCNSLTAHSN